MPLERPSREAGVGLIAAIFVIIILGLLGTALIRLLTTEQASVNRELASTQAFFAAETAVQWGIYQAIQKNSSTAGPVFDGDPPKGLANCDDPTKALDERTQALIDFDHFGTAPTFSSPEKLYRFEVEGVCYQGRPEEARRRLEVRFRE